MKDYKNRNRKAPVFANINLQGPCNYKCYFCLGNDICLSNKINYLNINFKEWKKFDEYLNLCHSKNIKKIYLTGQNTDPLLYSFLKELIEYLKEKGFQVGIRTNGYLALSKMSIINCLNGSFSLSIHSLVSETHEKNTKVKSIPNWNKIIPMVKVPLRVAIVVNRFNESEIFSILKYLSDFQNIRYIQLRCVATDTRYDELKDDIRAYENVKNKIEDNYKCEKEFYTSKIYNIYGKEVDLWRTVQTDINSLNYFTEGIISDDYFIIEGYNKEKGISEK